MSARLYNHPTTQIDRYGVSRSQVFHSHMSLAELSSPGVTREKVVKTLEKALEDIRNCELAKGNKQIALRRSGDDAAYQAAIDIDKEIVQLGRSILARMATQPVAEPEKKNVSSCCVLL